MNLDRDYQKNLLSMLEENYPRISNKVQNKIRSLIQENESKYLANAYYLQCHGLIENAVGKQNGATSTMFSLGIPELTVKGVDFLQQDGGLSAILNIQTIKLDKATLELLLTSRIEQAAHLSTEQKQGLIYFLKEAGQKAMQHTLEKLIDTALENPEAIIHIIQNACE